LFPTLSEINRSEIMASWNEITPDPDVQELSKIAEGAHGVEPVDKPADPLHEPASAGDFTINQVDASDLTDDLTGSFDGEIGLPRV